MAEGLSQFAGDAAYLDAVTLVAYLDRSHPFHEACRAFMSQAFDPGRPITLFTAALTFDEIVFVLLQELVARPPYQVTRDRARYLDGHADAVRALTEIIAPPVEALAELLTVEPVTLGDLAQMLRIMAMQGLLPRDAIHYAVARRLGLTAFVSDDDAFAGLPGIQLYKP